MSTVNSRSDQYHSSFMTGDQDMGEYRNHSYLALFSNVGITYQLIRAKYSVGRLLMQCGI